MNYGRNVLSVTIATTGIVLGIRATGWFQPLELDALDRMVQYQPEMTLDHRLLVVGINESDIAQQNDWPISDEVIAQLLAELQRYNPRVVGLDLYRNISHPPGEAALRAQLSAANVVVIEKLGGEDAVPAPQGIPPQQIGFNNLLPDIDQVFRRNLLLVNAGDTQYYSFALQLSRAYLATENISLNVRPDGISLGQSLFPDLTATSGSYQNLDARGYQILTRFHSRPNPARQVSLSQVLNRDINPEWVKDKIVVIGTVAPSIKDVFNTPHNTYHPEHPLIPGVVVHAHFTSHILRTVLEGESVIWFWTDSVEGLWILLWALIGGTIAWRIQHPLLISTGVLIVGAVLTGGCYLLFLHGGWIPLWPAAIGLAANTVIVFAYQTLYKLLYDTLTALPKKALLLRAIDRSLKHPLRIKSHMHVAVLFIDLDGFKRINESLGPDKGDRILLAVAERLKKVLPARSHLSRLVGDKFVALVTDLGHKNGALTLARTIQDYIQHPIKVDGQEFVISASIGIALAPDTLSSNASELLRDAQTAVHQAKSRGKNHIDVFTHKMRLNIIAHFQTEADLRLAIDRQELRTYYQPFISLQTGEITGFEALVRWQHPEQGLVSPGKFIPVAEDTDLIIPIGQWVLQEACQQMYRWHHQFPSNAQPIISVNLSGRQFTQPHLVQYIERTLEETGLDGKYLKLELTESILMDDVASVIDTLHRMKRLNLQISIDDFGTGYSSLSYLHRFPIDTLKIDRSFVMNINDLGEDHAIVETIIALGHHLKMDVIAEGIETAEQAKALTSLGCEYGQGFFFAKPLPAEDVADLLAQRETVAVHKRPIQMELLQMELLQMDLL